MVVIKLASPEVDAVRYVAGSNLALVNNDESPFNIVLVG
jgi:hypothetical protein